MITITNYAALQHYSRRNPPWIKLYRTLLDSKNWRSLSDKAARLLIELWLLASEHDEKGVIDLDISAIAWRLRYASNMTAAIEKAVLELQTKEYLVVSDTVLAPCRQGAIPETEGKKRQGRDKPPEGVSIPEKLNTPEFKEAWKKWEQHRAELKKTLTKSTAEAQLKKLAKMGPEAAVQSITNSIESGWTGLFKPKNEDGTDIQEETDPGMLDYARQFNILVETQPDDDSFQMLYKKARDNFGAKNGVKRLKAAAAQIKEVAE